MVCYLENLGATAAGNAVPTREQEALREIKQALLNLHLKSQRELQRVMDSTLDIIFPEWGCCSNFKLHRVSSWAQFKVDMAYIVVTRDESFRRCAVRFGWADASPQGPFDFLMFKCKYIFVSELVKTYEAMITLVNSQGVVLGDGVGSDEELSLQAVEARRAANQVLENNVLEYVYAPFLLCCV